MSFLPGLPKDRTVPLLIIVSTGAALGLILRMPAPGEVPKPHEGGGMHAFLDGKKIAIGNASLASLKQITGLTRRAAQGLVEFRQVQGPICAWDVLLDVKGVGPKTLEKLQANVLLDEGCALK